jgi:hypothetical protein
VDLVIRSNVAGHSLTLAPDQPEYFVATLDCGALRAVLRFYELSAHTLAHFFRALADDWRGWDGQRSWASLEGDIEFGATHDGLGSVALTVGLRTDRLDGDGGWFARAVLILDAGQALTTIATDAREVLGN